MISSSLLTVDMNSSSESMPVVGVGGAGSCLWCSAAREPLLGALGTDGVVVVAIFASAAFRFLVVGGILAGVGAVSHRKMPVRERRANTVMTT